MVRLCVPCAPFGARWRPSAPAAPCWRPLAPFGARWRTLAPFGAMCARVTPFGTTLRQCAPCGASWRPVAPECACVRHWRIVAPCFRKLCQLRPLASFCARCAMCAALVSWEVPGNGACWRLPCHWVGTNYLPSPSLATQAPALARARTCLLVADTRNAHAVIPLALRGCTRDLPNAGNGDTL